LTTLGDDSTKSANKQQKNGQFELLGEDSESDSDDSLLNAQDERLKLIRVVENAAKPSTSNGHDGGKASTSTAAF
jgi:hypothetical protein